MRDLFLILGWICIAASAILSIYNLYDGRRKP